MAGENRQEVVGPEVAAVVALVAVQMALTELEGVFFVDRYHFLVEYVLAVIIAVVASANLRFTRNRTVALWTDDIEMFVGVVVIRGFGVDLLVFVTLGGTRDAACE